MYLEVAMSFIIVSYLRKTMQKNGFSPALNKLLMIAMAAIVGVIILETAVPGGKKVAPWLMHAVLLAILWFGFNRPELKAAKSMIYSVLPLTGIIIISDLVELVSNKFYDNYEEYFQTTQLFGFIWMFAFWLVTKRQRKALEDERLKALEKEKEYRITENMKAALELQVADRTAALTQQKNALEAAIAELKATQDQLVQSEKNGFAGRTDRGYCP